MVRTQIQLDEAKYEAIRRMAHRNRVSFAEMVRRLVDAGMEEDRGYSFGTGAEALLSIAGTGASGLGDLGERHDDYVEGE